MPACCGKVIRGKKTKVTLYAKVPGGISMKRVLVLLPIIEVFHSISNFVAACAVDDYGQAFFEAIRMLLHVLKVVRLWTH